MEVPKKSRQRGGRSRGDGKKNKGGDGGPAKKSQGRAGNARQNNSNRGGVPVEDGDRNVVIVRKNKNVRKPQEPRSHALPSQRLREERDKEEVTGPPFTVYLRGIQDGKNGGERNGFLFFSSFSPSMGRGGAEKLSGYGARGRD